MVVVVVQSIAALFAEMIINRHVLCEPSTYTTLNKYNSNWIKLMGEVGMAVQKRMAVARGPAAGRGQQR